MECEAETVQGRDGESGTHTHTHSHTWKEQIAGGENLLSERDDVSLCS